MAEIAAPAPALDVDRAQLVTIPLDADGLIERLTRRPRGDANVADWLAHEIGDLRFATAFGERARPASWTRAQGAFAVFQLDVEARRLTAYTCHSLETLAAIPLPPGWSRDPLVWECARATPLLDWLEARHAITRPFVADVFPKVVMKDPQRHRPNRPQTARQTTLDAFNFYRERPDKLIAELRLELTPDTISRELAYAAWLQRRISDGSMRIDAETIEFRGETTSSTDAFKVPSGTGQAKVPRKEENRSFAVTGARIAGQLTITDARSAARRLLAGIGKRKAYGHGMLVVG